MKNIPSSAASIFDIKPVAEWIALSKEKPTPKFLFGEFWLEGELSILFADTGKGKSVLAVQIAESIARGVPVAPLKLTSEPQKVLYFDFELSDKQFEMRYAKDVTDDEPELIGHYEFSPNFLRAEVRPNPELPEGRTSFEDALISQIELAVKRTGARVLIIDNITYLRSGAVRTGEAIMLMKRLKDIKTELNLSILVLAHTPKRNTTWPLNVNDLQGSKVLANFADNIFAIGQSKYDTSHRYIKHIKPRSTEMLYDAQHVPSFRLGKRDGNFLSFSFFGWRQEAVHLSSKYDSYRLKRADEIKRLADSGLSQRQIAERCDTSAASVNRFLQMWSPYDEEKEQIRIEIEQQREQERLQALRDKNRRAETKRRERKRRAQQEKLVASRVEDRPSTADAVVENEREDRKLVSPEGKPLTIAFDGSGREIYVEEFREWDQRPKRWYQLHNNGKTMRYDRDAHGIIRTELEEFSLEVRP